MKRVFPLKWYFVSLIKSATSMCCGVRARNTSCFWCLSLKKAQGVLHGEVPIVYKSTDISHHFFLHLKYNTGIYVYIATIFKHINRKISGALQKNIYLSIYQYHLLFIFLIYLLFNLLKSYVEYLSNCSKARYYTV